MKVILSGRGAGKSYWTNQAIKRLMDDLCNRPIEELILSEGKVYGSRYYCVEPIGGNWKEMEQWCLDTFGSAGSPMWEEKTAPEPAQRWYKNNRRFWFRNDKDRTWFLMRWR
jgi:hypothetical protein